MFGTFGTLAKRLLADNFAYGAKVSDGIGVCFSDGIEVCFSITFGAGEKDVSISVAMAGLDRVGGNFFKTKVLLIGAGVGAGGIGGTSFAFSGVSFKRNRAIESVLPTRRKSPKVSVSFFLREGHLSLIT
jgi:hypothetical protein